MINKKLHKNLLLGFVAATMSLSILGCGVNMSDLLSATQVKTSSLEVQAVDTQTSQAKQAPDQTKLIADLKTTNPEVAAQLEAIQSLTGEERKTKMDELVAKYPDVLKKFAPRGDGKGQGMDKGHEKGQGPDFAKLIADLKTTNPEVAAQLEAIQSLTGEERKTKMDELLAKYPDVLKNFAPPQRDGGIDKQIADLKTTNPDLAAQLEALKTLTPEERKTKMDELIAKYPDVLKNFAPPQGGPQGGKGQGGMEKQIADLKTTNPDLAAQLEAIQSLTGEERKTKMDELIAKYPDVLKNFAPPQGGDKGQGMGKGHDKGHGPDIAKLIADLKTTNADLAAQLEALKDLTPEQRKSKMDELIAKYPDVLKNCAIPAKPAQTTTNDTTTAQ